MKKDMHRRHARALRRSREVRQLQARQKQDIDAYWDWMISLAISGLLLIAIHFMPEIIQAMNRI